MKPTDTNEEEKKKLTPRQVFWIRFVFWVIFACILPVSFIIWRFDLFTKVTRISIGGWGLVAILIIAFFAIDLMKYIKSGMKPSLASQCINGFVKVILPMCTLLLIVYCIKDSLDAFMQALSCAILCETIAIPINPMPMWVYHNKLDMKREEIEYATGGGSLIGRMFEANNARKESRK